MAKKKTEQKTVITEDIPDGGAIPGAPEDFTFDVDIDTELEEVRAKGSRILIKVYKILPGHKPIYQFETDSRVSEAQLQQYGGGLYQVCYFIDGKRKHVDEMEVADAKANGQHQPQSPESVQIAMLREQSQMNRDLLMAVLGRTNPTTPAPTPMSEIATMWGLIHGMQPGNGGGNGTFDKLIEIFKLGMELGGKGGGEMDWKSALISTARELAPGILQIAAKTQGVEVHAQQIPQQTAVSDVLKHGLSLIKPKIVAGLPVGLALDWVIANASDPKISPFLALAVQKEFQDLVNADNEVANEPYNTWLRQFLSSLKEQFKSAAVEESDEIPAEE
jgi:hypothetical protein